MKNVGSSLLVSVLILGSPANQTKTRLICHSLNIFNKLFHAIKITSLNTELGSMHDHLNAGFHTLLNTVGEDSREDSPREKRYLQRAVDGR